MDAYLQNTLSNWSKLILSFLQQFDELTKINVIGDNKICLWINSFWQALCASSVSQCKFILRGHLSKTKRTNLCVRETPILILLGTDALTRGSVACKNQFDTSKVLLNLKVKGQIWSKKCLFELPLHNGLTYFNITWHKRWDEVLHTNITLSA